MDRDLEEFREIVRNSQNIVFFGGAGVSTESNIPDFRSTTGLYNHKNNKKYPPEYMLSRTFFDRHTSEFYDFYKNTMIYREAKPNKAHLVLAELEKQGKLKAIVTQNIDGLHQAAGSKEVLELHGSVSRNYCMDCLKFHTLGYVLEQDEIPKCDVCNGIVKPDVVLYEEGLDMEILNRAIEFISGADLLIVGGTSLTVSPAANLITYFKGDKLILINKAKTPYDSKAYLAFNDSIGKVLEYII